MDTIDQLDPRPGRRHPGRPAPSPTAPGPTTRWSGPRPNGPPSCWPCAGPGPFHVALLMDNVPEYVFWMGGAALAGAVIVGGNPTHRGDELARDLSHTECQLLVTNSHVPGPRRGPRPGAGPAPRTDPGGRRPVGGRRPGRAPTAHSSPRWPAAPSPTRRPSGVTEDSLGLLLFTSGTSGAPKACLCSQGRLARIGSIVTQMFEITADDVCYLAMPLFHSNALMAGWAPALAAGATAALRERFSASQFLVDVRRYGVTYFNYVGKPLSYILATPEHPDDADNTLRRCFGNEAAEADVARFAERFGCTVQDAYGSTEGGAAGAADTRTRPAARWAGHCPERSSLDPETGEECPRAVFDEHGRLLNAEEAIGEMVSQTGGAGFEGYWRNAEAEQSRVRERLVLDGRPGLSRRGRLLLLRWTRLRLAPGRRRELRLGPRRRDPPAPSRRGPGLRLRRARHRGGRPGHGHAPPPRGTHLRPGGIRRLPGRRGRHGHEVGAAVRAGHRRAAR